MKTPVARIVFPSHSPQNGYLAPPEKRKASRWREDWQQLEVLVGSGIQRCMH